MGRIRTIKPEFPQSESIGHLSREARLLFIQIWTLCDDEGRSRGDSRMLASLLYPYDLDAPYLIEVWVAELETADCIKRYKADSFTYLEVCNWQKHQKIDHPGKSKIPPFDESSRIFANPREEPREDQGSRIKERIKEGIKEKTLVPTQENESARLPVPVNGNGHNKTAEGAAIIQKVFEYYIRKMGKNEKIYTLTPLRMKHGLSRYSELLGRLGQNPSKVGETLCCAIDSLAASEFHMGKNDRNQKYNDWIDNLFKSKEKLEKWLEQS